jgi:nucleotide-binding universal stress UspA family protein
MTTYILFVPEEYEMRLKTVFVPIDFSRFSGRTLHMAQQLSKKISAKLIVQYVYRVPTGYHKTGKTYDEFAQIMRNHAEKDMQRFFTTHQIDDKDVEVVLNLDKSENAAQKIYETALNHKADLIIMSSKGRTGLASVLIGRETEKLIHPIKKMPLLIAKDEKESISFVDALFKI